MMRPTLKAAAETAEARGVSLEIIDLLTIAPLDGQTIGESVRKTGRCVVVQEAPKSFGVAAEIIARINDKVLLYLEAPVKRITGFDVVTPYFGREKAYIPTPERIRRGIEETLDF
jgi:pyruvate dehydrogenase E1 component beta subunit